MGTGLLKTYVGLHTHISSPGDAALSDFIGLGKFIDNLLLKGNLRNNLSGFLVEMTRFIGSRQPRNQ